MSHISKYVCVTTPIIRTVYMDIREQADRSNCFVDMPLFPLQQEEGNSASKNRSGLLLLGILLRMQGRTLRLLCSIVEIDSERNSREFSTNNLLFTTQLPLLPHHSIAQNLNLRYLLMMRTRKRRPLHCRTDWSRTDRNSGDS